MPPDLPTGALVRVPDRGEMFVRYLPGPPGAPTVLLLHGWMASADLNWWSAFGPLAGRYHVLAIDHRGHGRGIRSIEPFTLEDCADDAAALLDALGVRRAVVAGYSMGGPIALLLARRHPHRVRGLVLVATAAELGRTGLDRGMAVGVQVLGQLIRSGLPDRAIRALLRAEPTALAGIAELLPWAAGEMKRLHPADIVDAGRAIAAFDARPWLSELAPPAVSVITVRDRGVRPSKQRAMAAALNARVVELDAGHGACVTEPEAFAVAVREAIDLVAPRRLRGFSRPRVRLARVRSLVPIEEVRYPDRDDERDDERDAIPSSA